MRLTNHKSLSRKNFLPCLFNFRVVVRSDTLQMFIYIYYYYYYYFISLAINMRLLRYRMYYFLLHNLHRIKKIFYDF
jgi:hypothetical protein